MVKTRKRHHPLDTRSRKVDHRGSTFKSRKVDHYGSHVRSRKVDQGGSNVRSKEENNSDLEETAIQKDGHSQSKYLKPQIGSKAARQFKKKRKDNRSLNSARTKEEIVREPRCVICLQVLRPNSLFLHGKKCERNHVRENLQWLLPSQDFQELYETNICHNPQICNLCFVIVKKIPGTVARLQKLTGQKLNIQLYKPHRVEWKKVALNDETSGDSGVSSGSGQNRSVVVRSSPRTRGLETRPLGSTEPSDTTTPPPNYFDQQAGETPPAKVRLLRGCVNGNHARVVQESGGSGVGKVEAAGKITADAGGRADKDNPDTLSGSFTDISSGRDNLLLPETYGINNGQLDLNVLVIDKKHQGTTLTKTKLKQKLKHNIKSSMNAVKIGKQGLQKCSSSRDINVETVEINKSYSNVRKNIQELMPKKNDLIVILPKRTRSSTVVNGETHSESYFTPDLEDSDGEDDYLPPKPRDDYLPPKSRDDYLPPKPRDDYLPPKPRDDYLPPKPRDDYLPPKSRYGYLPPKSRATRYKATSRKKQKILLPKSDHVSDDKKTKYESNVTVEDRLSQKSINKTVQVRSNKPKSSESRLKNKGARFSGQIQNSGDFSNNQMDMHVLENLSEQSTIKLKELEQKDHETAHGPSTFFCTFPNCTRAFRLASSLEVHTRSHSGLSPMGCPVSGCNELFESRRELSKHQASQHQGELKQTTTTNKEAICCDLCGNKFSTQKVLMRHKRRSHGVGRPGQHQCPYEGCQQSFVKREKLEIHLCSHSPERKLFCEKCGKTFSCQRYLDVHYKIHLKNELHAVNPPQRNIACEFAGCSKMFTTRDNMKNHVLNQHKGRKPKAAPGVYFSCSVKGCEKRFSFRSTLYRHNKLVHKGGDYKLGRQVVRYTCPDESCCREFNRKHLLEEHQVMEHGQATGVLYNREVKLTEEMCHHCGMVLSVARLSEHQLVYHNQETSKEKGQYLCKMKGCDEVFGTPDLRQAHVQQHIEHPPFRCHLEPCRQTFFLEKNLDSHLWSHSKKNSVCDFGGCGRHFDDQLQLARHSKCHYDGKMKCPWPNCDNWLTETGHLKPHFVAHIRSQRANLDTDFVCQICHLAFSSRWGLMIHQRIHGDEAAAKPSLARQAKFVCEESGCHSSYEEQKGFFDHFLYHYVSRPASCVFPGCAETFRNMVALSRHTKCHYGGKVKCPWPGCAKMFATVFIVKKHLYRHIISDPAVASGRPYSCHQCYMVFRLESNLLSHQQHHSQKSEYVCPTCGKKGYHTHTSAAHRAENRPRRSQQCQQCGAQYATVSGLKFHLLQKHQIGHWPFQCNYCRKGFVSSRELQRHLPSHTKEKPFACDICGASFASHTGHRAHMRKHTGEKYTCDVEGCGKTYSTAISLRGHKAQHAGFSKTCPYCFKTYKNPYGHKCKAGRESKHNAAKRGMGLIMPAQQVAPVSGVLQPTQLTQAVLQPPRLPQTVLPPPGQTQTLLLPPQSTQATSTSQEATVLPEASSMPAPHTNLAPLTSDALQPIIRPDMLNPNMFNQTHFRPHSFVHGIPTAVQGIPQTSQTTPPQIVSHSQTHMQGQEQFRPMMRDTSMDIAGDFPYNNYVLFWDSHNIS